jgi:hypothetical protein
MVCVCYRVDGEGGCGRPSRCYSALVASTPQTRRLTSTTALQPSQPYTRRSPAIFISWRDRTETTASLFLGDGRDADAAHLYLGDIHTEPQYANFPLGEKDILWGEMLPHSAWERQEASLLHNLQLVRMAFPTIPYL